MNKRLRWVPLVWAIVVPTTATASICTVDAVPAATLLLPYFEVGLSPEPDDALACDDADTVVTVNNAGAAPALASVVLWTDWGMPTGKFHLALEARSTRTISLCDLLGRGVLPEPGDWSAFPSCSASDFEISFESLDQIQNGHAGYPVAAIEGCLGEALNGPGGCSGGGCSDGTAGRGYITIDNVNDCSPLVPGEPGYFAPGRRRSTGGGGVANNVNPLWGDWFIVQDGRALGSNDLVHIEAHDALTARHLPILDPTRRPDPRSGGLDPRVRSTLGRTRNDNSYTFYGRYVDSNGPENASDPRSRSNLGGFDNREPLATTWSLRVINPPTDSSRAFDGGTSLHVWRDAGVAGDASFACGLCADGAGPAWCPLEEASVVCTDDDGEAIQLCGPRAAGSCFPLATNRVPIDALIPPGTSASCTLDLNPRPARQRSRPRTPRPVAQSWVAAPSGPTSSPDGPTCAEGASQVIARLSACQPAGGIRARRSR